MVVTSSSSANRTMGARLGPDPWLRCTTHGRRILQTPPMTLSHMGTRMTVTPLNFLMQVPTAAVDGVSFAVFFPLWCLDTNSTAARLLWM